MMLYYLFFLHWIGDFVMQHRWMANNKSHNHWALLLHVLVYSTVIGLGLYLINPEWIRLPEFYLFVLFNLSAHWMTDAATSKITTYLHGKQQIYLFFVVIGLDQLIHIVTLLLSSQTMGKQWLT